MYNKLMLIDGKWCASESGETLSVYNPVDCSLIGTVPVATENDVLRAVAAAGEAFKDWGNRTPFERGKILRKAAECVTAHADEIAKLMTMEQGKPFAEARGEVLKGAETLRYYAEEGERVYGRIIPNESGNDYVSQVIYQPVGVVGCFAPWNYPIELVTWKVAASMASGCCCILKVPSETPLSPIRFIEAMLEAGIPKGVVNVISGRGSRVGDWLIKNPTVKKLAFTGSTRVGKDIMEKSASTLKRISLELGGSEPMIIMKDCDLDQAVKGATRRSWRNMGQICIAVNRIYVERCIYEEFLEKFKKSTEALTIGNGLTDACDLGPMCTEKGVENAKRHIADALEKGARLICGGKKPAGEKYEKGYFFEPTILADATHDMLVMSEETFGPVVGVMPFDTVDEAIRLANDCKYGLASIAYTSSLTLAMRFARELNSGNVAINNVDAGVINAPYGGWYESGFGHEHGPEGLYEYLNIKHVRIRF